MSSSSSSRRGDALDMAEFKAIVTASFDDIGSHLAFNNIRALQTTRLAPPSPEDNKTTTATTTRRSPLSFLRKVKSHATSLLVPPQSRSDPAASSSLSSRSFVPALVPVPVPAPARRQPTPAAFASSSSLSRNLLTRAFGKHPQQSPHFPPFPDRDVEPKSSFFDDDEDDVIDRRLFSTNQTRRISSVATARPNSRLSSAFAAAPTLFGLSSPSVSTPSLIPEKHGVVRPEPRVHVCAYLLSWDTLAPDIYKEAGIQIVTETQASHKTLAPKVGFAPLQFIVLVKRSFPSHAILPFSPILRRLCKL